MADAILQLTRAIVLALGGVGFGFALIQGRLYYERWRAGEGERMFWVMLIRLALALALAVVWVEAAHHLGEQTVTWKLPGAAVLFVLSLVAMLGIFRDDERRQDAGHPRRRVGDHE